MGKWKYMKHVLNAWNQKLKFYLKWQMKISRIGSAVIKNLKLLKQIGGKGSELCE